MLARQDWSGLQKLLAFHAANGGIPWNYKRVDYLDCTGNDARIDTGVPGNNNTLKFELAYAVMSRSNWAGHFGNYDGEDKRCWRVIQGPTTAQRNMYIGANNRKAGSASVITVVNESTGDTVGIRVDYELSYGKCVSHSADGTTSTLTITDDTTQDESTTNICIGAVKTSSTGGTHKGRFWYCKIWSHDALIRDYVPCVRKSDSKAGFYDLVNGTFNPSIGSAEFVAGMDA